MLMIRLRRVLPWLLGLVLLPSCGQAALHAGGKRHHRNPIHFTLLAHPSAVGGHTRSAVLAAALSGVDASGLDIRPLTTPPPGSTGQWLSATVPSESDVLDQWKALLVAGADKHLAEINGGAPIQGIAIGTSAGVFEYLDVSQCCNSSPTTAVASVLTQQITAALKQLNLTPVSVSFEEPEPGLLAPEVVAETADPSAASSISDPADAVFGDIQHYEGTYLKIVDSSGSTVRETAYAMRTGNGLGNGTSSPLGG